MRAIHSRVFVLVAGSLLIFSSTAALAIPFTGSFAGLADTQSITPGGSSSATNVPIAGTFFFDTVVPPIDPDLGLPQPDRGPTRAIYYFMNAAFTLAQGGGDPFEYTGGFIGPRIVLEEATEAQYITIEVVDAFTTARLRFADAGRTLFHDLDLATFDPTGVDLFGSQLTWSTVHQGSESGMGTFTSLIFDGFPPANKVAEPGQFELLATGGGVVIAFGMAALRRRSPGKRR